MEVGDGEGYRTETSLTLSCLTTITYFSFVSRKIGSVFPQVALVHFAVEWGITRSFFQLCCKVGVSLRRRTFGSQHKDGFESLFHVMITIYRCFVATEKPFKGEFSVAGHLTLIQYKHDESVITICHSLVVGLKHSFPGHVERGHKNYNCWEKIEKLSNNEPFYSLSA